MDRFSAIIITSAVVSILANALKVWEFGSSRLGSHIKNSSMPLFVVHETDCDLYQMTDEQIYRLYYQNPKLGFFFMRLIVERLLREVKRGAIKPETI